MEGGVTPFSSSMAPSGSYILIVVSQPLSEEHKQIILQRLDKGLLSWDVNSTGCDLSGLEYALSTNIKDSVTESDVLIQHSTESLGVEVLLSPTVRTLKQCVRNLLSTPTSHKQLIHAGYTFAGSGSWILENGTFSFAEFLEIFKQADVQNQKRCTINVHCAEEGDWNKTNFAKDIFTKYADVALNPSEKVNHVPGSEHLIKCLSNALITQSLEEMMKPSPLVGNIRFNRPTIYMFPAGQGDCALFGINGFNMLIDGGFNRKPCSWDFVRHLDRLDAVLVTRIAESNVSGMATLMKRNALNNANPQIGYVFCNIAESKSNPLKNGITEKKDDLIVSVVNEGHNFVQTLNDLKLKPHQCWRDSSIDPFVLYHKVGQGTLEMHVLSPPRDSKEMKLFLSEWNAYKETFSGIKSELKNVENMIPLSHATSICAILVWRPEDPKDTITRILFPGSAPQNKILEGLEKLRVLNILNQPVVTKASLNIPSSKVISNKVEKSVSRASIPNRNNTASPALSVSSIASRNGDIGGLKKDVKEIKKVTKEIKKENKEIKTEIKKEIRKSESGVKKVIKSENTVKKDAAVKKESVKDIKKDTKDVKKVIKKETKDVKAVNDKKDVKLAAKKDTATPAAKTSVEIKKYTSTTKKSTTPIKKDTGKPPVAPKATDTKKSVSKVSESKVNNKITTETKSVTKTKPKSTSASPKTPNAPKTKPVAVPKPGSKMTKAVAASSIVASAVAVTVAAVELNEKKEIIEDTEPEISEKDEKDEEIVAEVKETAPNEKSVDDVVSPLPPEALSPTPSESVSLTPSDTLSSAPLETVSPTPPLPNETISVEEKDVNEIKELEQDMPFEQGKNVEASTANEDLKTENEVNDIEAELAKHQASNDVMSTSFIAEKQFEETDEERFEKSDFRTDESTPLKAEIDNEILSEKDDISQEKETEELKHVEENYATSDNYAVDEQESYVEKDTTDEKEITEDQDHPKEDVIAETVNQNYAVEENYLTEQKDIADEKETGNQAYFAKESDTFERKEMVQKSYANEEKDIYEEKEIMEEKNLAHDADSDEESDIVEEKETAEEKDTDDDIDVIEEKDDIKEKDVVEDENMYAHLSKKEDTKAFDIGSNEGNLKNSYEEDAKGIDEQLAGLTMEGSFCAGMTSANETNISFAPEREINDTADTHFSTEIVDEHFEKKVISESESHFKTDLPESDIADNKISEEIQEEYHHYSLTDQVETHAESYEIQQFEAHENVPQETHKVEDSTNEELYQEKNKEHDSDLPQYEKSENKVHVEEQSKLSFESSESHFDKFSHIHSMEASFHQDAYEHYDPTNIDDPEMQETSVDEPEDIVRKESVVSITLNDETAEQNYAENWRRKSGTESEDDVDIGKYMSKDHTMNEENLYVRRGSDSDEEDVVKSPTPHAVVDYEGQLDEAISTINQESECTRKEVQNEKEMYSNEKEDFDEKDRDSAEEHDTDEGEMIRHPTPPGMKYSDEEMRDPIGQHFITHPSLKPQGTDITEQPLYEEAEDTGSERSVSPIIEQPVFGNTVEADFPELVTVSGGTTPSEPQSPKANFDAKKFAADATVMEALSEHDASESSTHSPSCQDGSTAFDLQGSERSVIEVQSLQDDEAIKTTDEIKQSLPVNNDVSAEKQVSTPEQSGKTEITTYDDKDDNQEDKQETPSDEEESSSEDENSESHSKDKSDAMGDKSDVERDDRSDIHNDDKSDHYHDKSDIANDDDDKSDIHDDEQLYRQQNKSMEHETDDGFQKDFKTGIQEDTEAYSKDKSEEQTEKEYAYEDQFDKLHDIQDQHTSLKHEEDEESNLNISNANYVENIDANNTTEIKNDTFVDDNYEAIASNTALNTSFDKKSSYTEDYLSQEKHIDSYSRNILENESTADSLATSFQYENSGISLGNEKPGLSDYDLTNSENIINEKQNDDKIDDNEASDTFQESENDFENSKPDTGLSSFNTSAFENKNETTSVESDSKGLATNLPEYSEDIPSNFSSSDGFEQLKTAHEKFLEDVNPEYIEHSAYVENTNLSQMTEAHQYENFSQCDENTHITKETYSESDLIKNTDDSQNETNLSSSQMINVSETNLSYINSQMQSFTANNEYEYASVSTTNKTTDIDEYHPNVPCKETDMVTESYSKSTHFEHETESTNHTFSTTNDYKQSTESYSLHGEQYMHEESHFIESQAYNVPLESTSEHFETESTEVTEKYSFTPETMDLNSNGTEEAGTVAPEYESIANGKDHSSFDLPPSGMTSEFFTSEVSQREITTDSSREIEQDSTYLINNRFHSDSPEDNTMRSDSSPDVPYPAELPDKFSDIKNSISTDICSETYTDDYKNNMNFSNTDAISLSTQNHSLNANQNNTYAEFSEERNSPVRGNVSPFAYTNKAYTREEEDIDGNHIYKEETSEVIKQVEFDGNNLQTLSTNQVSSVMGYSQEYQDMQYSTGANYDFHLEEWGKPMGLPTPPDSSQKTVKKGEKGTVKAKTTVDINGKAHSPSVSSKQSSPSKKPKPKVAKESSSSPIYVDLAYVPQHADPEYCDVEFFKKIRARYYVISSVNPSKEVLNALLEAKKTWNEDLSVTIIPTYETDTLGYWMAQNQNDLAEYSIDVSPSASRCTVNLQDHQTSCSAYRLEF